MNNYLEKRFLITERESEQSNMLPNDVKLIIHTIEKLETYFVIAKTNQFTQ